MKKLIYTLIPTLMFCVALTTSVGCGGATGTESDGVVTPIPTEDPKMEEIEVKKMGEGARN